MYLLFIIKNTNLLVIKRLKLYTSLWLTLPLCHLFMVRLKSFCKSAHIITGKSFPSLNSSFHFQYNISLSYATLLHVFCDVNKSKSRNSFAFYTVLIFTVQSTDLGNQIHANVCLQQCIIPANLCTNHIKRSNLWNTSAQISPTLIAETAGDAIKLK